MTSSNPKRVAAYTLGCKANQYDTNRLLAGLKARGFAIRDFNEIAELYIINTCTVTRTGENKSLQMIRRAKEKMPEALIVVCGCAAKLNADAIRQTGADFIFDAREPESLYNWLQAAEPSASVYFQNRTRAYIKIQDGCDRFCAYCIVPYARGPVVSRSLHDILEEARSLIANGVREIVLTGIQTAAYGKDVKDGISFPDLIGAVAFLPGLTRLRLGSIEPYAVDGPFLEAVRHPVVCGHFHLSLQSGCDEILAKMNRRYNSASYLQAANHLKTIKPNAALTTDIMVGFPGETDENYLTSLRFTEEIGFARMHVFEFSSREGTPAASFPNPVPTAVKKERGKQMRRVAQSMQHRFLTSHIGQTKEVLFEVKRSGWWEGHTDNYITVRAQKAAANILAEVRLTHIDKGIMYGG